MSSITVQQIETFLTIAKYMSILKAAETMYVSQPALSRMLQRFEENVGVRLFFRGNHGLQFTAEGKHLYKALEPIYKSLAENIQIAQTLSGQPAKKIRFVHPSVYDISDVYLDAKGYVNLYKRKYPDIEVTASLHEYTELRSAIEFGVADIAIVYDFVLECMKGISCKRITEFHFYLAMSAKHPLAVYDELPPAELLAKEKFYGVSYLDDEASFVIYEDACKQIGFTPKQFHFLPNMQTFFHAISEMGGLCLCSKYSHFGNGENIKYYDIPPLRKKKYVIAAWRSDKLSPEARLFIDTLPGETIQDINAAED